MKKLYAVTFLLMASVALFAQQKTWTGTNGNWNIPTNWSPVGVPQANTSVIFNTGTSVTIIGVPSIVLSKLTVTNNTQVTLQGASANRVVEVAEAAGMDITIDAASSLTLGSNLNLTLQQNADAEIKGTFDVGARTFTMSLGNTQINVTGKVINRGVISGSTAQRLSFANGSSYDHARNSGTIPNALWATNSTVNILGTTGAKPGNLTQAFGNLTWNAPNQTADISLDGNLQLLKGDLTIANTGTREVRLKTSTGTLDLDLKGNLNITGGRLNLISSTLGAINLMLHKDLNISGGELTKNGGLLNAANVSFNGTTEQKYSKTGGVISGNIDFSIEEDAKVDFGTSVLTSGGGFELKQNGRLIISHPQGLRSTGAAGAIQTATRSFSSNAYYEFRGPSTGVFNTVAPVLGIPVVTNPTRVRGLIINNSTTGVVTLGQPFTLPHFNEQGGNFDPSELQLLNGILKSTATNFITLEDNATASGVLDPDGDSRPNEYNLTSFVDGPLRKVGNDAFIFPVGKEGSGLHKIGITAPPSGGNTITSFTAQYFRDNPATLGTKLDAQLKKVSACEYWSLTRSGSNGVLNGVRVVLSWEANSGCGGQYVTDPLTLTVARFNDPNDTWVNEGNTTVLRTGNATAGTITSASTNPGFVGTYGFFALGTTSDIANPLPVVFGDVKAFEKNNGVQVDWSNLTETDVAEYSVERSANGRDFASIATQLPTSNQNDRANYSAFDANPVQGTNYYRIRAIEVTGKEVYSKVLAVTIGKDASELRLYPNPVIDRQVTINLANLKRGAYDLRVVGMSGQDIYRKTIQNQSSNFTQTLTLPSNLQPGVYNMIITADNFRQTRTFIVQ